MALDLVKERYFLENKSLHHFLKLFANNITTTSTPLVKYRDYRINISKYA